jgi:hypothetical protein
MFDVLRGVKIRVRRIATLLAGELGLTLPIGSLDMPALVTPLARMPWVNEQYRDASGGSLVGNILSQLGKAPVRLPWSLCAPGLNPLPNARQVFQGNPSRGALRSLNNLFGNRVVRVRLKPCMLSGNLSEFASSSSCIVPLKTLPAALESLTGVLNFSASIDSAVRIHREIDDTEINAQDMLYPHLFRLKDITNHGKVEDASNVHQIDFALPKCQQSTLPLATLVGNRQPSLRTPQRDLGIRAESKNAIIVGLRRIALKPTPCLRVQLVGVRDLGNAAYHHLCRKQKLLTTRVVGQRMQRELPKRLRVPCLASQPRTGTIRCRQRLKQGSMLGLCRQQLQVRHKFHVSSIELLPLRVKQELTRRLANLSFLSALQDGVSRKEK